MTQKGISVLIIVLLISLASLAAVIINPSIWTKNLPANNLKKTPQPSLAQISTPSPSSPTFMPSLTTKLKSPKPSPPSSPVTTLKPTPIPSPSPTPNTVNVVNQKNTQQTACTDPTQLEVWYSQPFNDKTAEQSESYFRANNLAVIYPPQSNTKYVIQIPAGTTGDYWIGKLKQDGFGNVTYYRIMGCDVAG